MSADVISVIHFHSMYYFFNIVLVYDNIIAVLWKFTHKMGRSFVFLSSEVEKKTHTQRENRGKKKQNKNH